MPLRSRILHELKQVIGSTKSSQGASESPFPLLEMIKGGCVGSPTESLGHMGTVLHADGGWPKTCIRSTEAGVD